MDQTILFDIAAARNFMDELHRLDVSVKVRRDTINSAVNNCQNTYMRHKNKYQDQISRAQRVLDEMQSLSSEENVPEDAQKRIAEAQMDMEAAEDALIELERLWEEYWPGVSRLQQRLEDCYEDFSFQRRSANRTLERYSTTLGKVRQIVQEENSYASGASESGSTSVALGWCPGKNWMSAVSADANGNKSVAITIGGKQVSFSCDKAGMAKAYRVAQRSGDEKMIRITAAMFEVETFRETLELGKGYPNVPQLGGYHGDVRKSDGKGYESHHIPSKAVQDRDADWLPTVSITAQDHALTASYRGKQSRVHHSALPGDSSKELSYKESVRQNLEQEEPGYLHAMKCELLDLKETTGSKYDGAISAYLDAVLDMLSTRGIPDLK